MGEVDMGAICGRRSGNANMKEWSKDFPMMYHIRR